MAGMMIMAAAKKAKAKEEKPKEAAKHAKDEAKEIAAEAVKEAPAAVRHEARKEHEEPKEAPADPAKEEHAHRKKEGHAHAKAEQKEEMKEAPAAPKAAEKHEKKEAPAKAEKKARVPKTRHSKKAKLTLSKGKRKRAIARVTIQHGKGRIRINKVLIDAMPNRYYRQLIGEVMDITGPRISEVDIDAIVTGGGAAGQIQAVRTAMASGLVDYFNDDSLARAFEEHGGRTMIVNDTRRVEPKKYKGPKARARYQKSYR